MTQATSVPSRAWVVTLAGMSVNLCLGILYVWSVWKKNLVAKPPLTVPGEPMTGSNAGWHYLSDAQATWAYVICGFMFALFMIPGGRLQDRYGPRVGATLAGVCLGGGCVIAGLMKSYLGLIVGFGLLGGIGMGLGYAAATPAAVKWFGPHRRGLIAGLVVAGYGGAALYIAPLAKQLIGEYGLTGSFVTLGVLFATVIVIAGRLLSMPPAGYVPPGPSSAATSSRPVVAPSGDWSAREMLGTWQFYALVLMFVAAAQSGLLVIANAASMLDETVGGTAEFGWVLASFGGLVNAFGRVGTGTYSDRVGRGNAYALNGIISVACLLALPWVMANGYGVLLFAVAGVAFWQYGGSLSLMPAFTADFYGTKNLGLNYGLVFLGWGIAFFVPQIAGYVKDATGSRAPALYLSAGLLTAGVVLSWFVTRPIRPTNEELSPGKTVGQPG